MHVYVSRLMQQRGPEHCCSHGIWSVRRLCDRWLVEVYFDFFCFFEYLCDGGGPENRMTWVTQVMLNV